MTMTEKEKVQKANELRIAAKHLRSRINALIYERNRLSGRVNPHFIEGLTIAIGEAEDKFIAMTNEANALTTPPTSHA
jgi:hypothetical protein